MNAADIARTAVGIAGNIIAGSMFLSPLPTFIEIWKKGSVGQFSAAPYLATLLNCMVWTLYGLPMVHPHSILVVTINGAGCVVELTYVIIFLIYSQRTNRLKVLLFLLIETLFIAALTLVSLLFLHTVHKRSALVGTISALFNIMMYASPLTIMKMVITTKSVEFMPFYVSLASFGNGVAWTTYALIRFDPFIAIPNGIGTLLATSQLILYATYYKSTKRMIAARKVKSHVDSTLSEVVLSNAAPTK
ncbi:bidirectional sugar transporter SWEET4-like [Senna tora]|uniref:Bidirectional sugar transporter SWEET n=1 Tax=Senna tora TaxID=362788 RepID=A0A834SVY1_9FABA|nr:bidirectional sugar transporter SWEET4-like [Senna tora]